MRRGIFVSLWLLAWGVALGAVACSWEASDQSLDVGGGPDGSRPPDAMAEATHDSGPDVADAANIFGDAPLEGSPEAAAEAEAASDAPFVIAKHPPLPSLINTGAPGPGVLTAPKVVTVTFAGDPFVSDLETLGAGIASSSWWDAVRGGWCDTDGGPCIGDGPPGVAVEIPTAPAKSYSDGEIQTWIQDHINSGALPSPGSGGISQSIYVLYFPQSTVVHYGGPSCQAFFGYHGAFFYTPPAPEGGLADAGDGGDGGGGQAVTYAVVDECEVPGPDGGVSMTDTLAFTTETASHEIMETTTDPVNGFSLDYNDPSTWGWIDIFGVEVGDLCDWFGPPPNYAYWPGENVPYNSKLTVQRIWSNTQVAAGLDPCLPVPKGVVFFAAAPQQQVFILDVGGSVTFEALGYSTAPVGEWTSMALDFTPTKKQYLAFTIAGGTDTDAGPEVKVHNGDVLEVTMTLLHDPGNTPNLEADGVMVSYSGPPDAPTAAYEWPFVVMTPADALDAGIDATITKRPVRKHGAKSGEVPRWPRLPWGRR